jgi:hypothetical protein
MIDAPCTSLPVTGVIATSQFSQYMHYAVFKIIKLKSLLHCALLGVENVGVGTFQMDLVTEPLQLTQWRMTSLVG